MDIKLAMQVMAGVCGVVLLILVMKKRMQFLLEFVLRMGVGTAVILWVNSILAGQGMASAVGLNPVTLLTSGSLGIPGIALLYAVSMLKNL